ncbi:MAG TPA: RtcB family protein [Patescibacteria group bacterium]|nr:RtcB family protein [Patescibacteria group bacterium]
MKIISSERLPIKSWADDLEEETLRQAKDLANHPFAFKWVCLMPDAHPGFGMPIGGVVATQKVIIPNAVGVDIGCGMIAVKTSLANLKRETITKIMGVIRKNIPVGFRHQKETKEWSGFSQAPEIEIVQKELSSARKQIGTLGSGNHFIEILKEEGGNVWLMLHSGSRNFGYKTAEHFFKKAVNFSERSLQKPPSRDLSFLPLDSQDGQDYFSAMNFCLAFAQANRRFMMEQVKEAYQNLTRCSFSPEIDVHHNYAAQETHFGERVFVHRKGAILAAKGQKGIIPGSMGTPSFIVEGLGNPESFMSCSHGAGRVMGRKKAIASLDLQKEQEKMKDIIGAPRSRDELQEAPSAYKDINKVIDQQKDLVKVLIKLNPIAVITGN